MLAPPPGDEHATGYADGTGRNDTPAERGGNRTGAHLAVA
jgi:hypothetical protein